MSLLALNTSIPHCVKLRYQILLGFFPFGMMLAPMGLIFEALLLSERFFSHFDVNSIGYVTADILISSLLFIGVSLMISGYTIGWVLNSLISRYIFNWETQKIKSVYLKSNLPKHWLNSVGESYEILTRCDSQPLSFKISTFIWGFLFFSIIYAAPTIIREANFSIEVALFNLIIWFIEGSFVSFLVRFFNKIKLQRIQ